MKKNIYMVNLDYPFGGYFIIIIIITIIIIIIIIRMIRWCK